MSEKKVEKPKVVVKPKVEKKVRRQKYRRIGKGTDVVDGKLVRKGNIVMLHKEQVSANYEKVS